MQPWEALVYTIGSEKAGKWLGIVMKMVVLSWILGSSDHKWGAVYWTALSVLLLNYVRCAPLASARTEGALRKALEACPAACGWHFVRSQPGTKGTLLTALS